MCTPNASSFNVATGEFIGLTSGWGKNQPTVDVTDTSLEEWSSSFTVRIDGDGDQDLDFTSPSGAIQITSNFQSDNFDGNPNGSDPPTKGGL